jgi:hypothetical protein
MGWVGFLGGVLREEEEERVRVVATVWDAEEASACTKLEERRWFLKSSFFSLFFLLFVLVCVRVAV